MTRDDGETDRRTILRTTAVGGTVMAGLAGCLGSGPEEESSPTQTATPVSLPEDVETETSSGEEGSDAPADERLAVGVLAPMNLPVGEAMWNAASMAADELNADGGVLGNEVAVELGDTKVSPGRAESEHRRLVVEEDCDATVGLFLGASLLQTLPSMADSEVVHLTTGSTEPRAGRIVSREASLTDDPDVEYERYKYHFRVGPLNLHDQADAMAGFVERHANERDWRRAALLTENLGELTPYADRLEARLDGVLATPVVRRVGGLSDWTPVYDEIEEANCDLALVGFTLGGTTAVNQWARQERDFEFGGVHVPSQSFEYWEDTGGRVEHVFAANVATPQTANTPQTQSFYERYIDRWGTVPIYSGVITYDAMFVLKQAIERAAESEGTTEVPDGDTLVRQLESLTFTGGTIVSEFEFTSPEAEYAHEPQWTSMTDDGIPVVQQWQYDPQVRADYGTMHAVAPERNVSAAFETPEWI